VAAAGGKMLNPRNLLVLLGFFAQGLIWDSYLFLAVLFILWFVALKFSSNQLRIPLRVEGGVLLAGCLISIVACTVLGQSWHFFLGDGLILLQLVRLMRPLNHREKMTSVVIAAFHFTVLCTLAPNIRFVVLYVAALFLFPGALKEVNSSAASQPDGQYPTGYRLIPSARVCFWMLLGSAFVFLTFPRFTGTPLQLRESMADQGSLLDSILDPRNGGKANSQQVLLQIEGDNLRYLRCLALTEFDGIRWMADSGGKLYKMQFLPEDQLENDRFKKRVVYVKSSQYLGHVLPVDGKVVSVKGNFFSTPYVSMHGVLFCDSMWTTGNNVFTNYVDFNAPPERLNKALRMHLIEHPRQSLELQNFVQERTAGETNLLRKARLLEKYLRDHFTYEIGSPELNRLTPVDDFIFRRKSGHCERFAASLALMLRMEGIPSRVAIGYVATSRNLFNGRAQVRFSDAHSWTEGYFDGVGWVTFDATPGPPSNGTGSDLIDLLDALDFAWYSHIVNFNGIAQHELFAATKKFLTHLPGIVWNTAATLFSILILVLILARKRHFKWFKLPKFIWRRKRASTKSPAKTSYEKMLEIIERRGIARKPEQTPFEFERYLKQERAQSDERVTKITEKFASSFYGEKPLSASDEAEVEAALRAMVVESQKSAER
jgi:hypothetical protein